MSKQPGAALQIKLEAALVLHRQGQLDQAEILYKEILRSHPRHFDALQLLATIELQRMNSVAAVELFDQALKINPNHAISLNNYGASLGRLKRYEDALDSFDRALAIKPDYTEALNNRGMVLHDLKRHEEALGSFDRALMINRNYAEALSNRGNALLALKRHEEALDSYKRALMVKPDYVEASINLGNAFSELKRYEEAVGSYGCALAIQPDYAFLYGIWLHAKMKICDWADVDDHFSRLFEKVERMEKASRPFPFLAISSSAALQKKAAETWIKAKHPINDALLNMPKVPKHGKIRIGYFSADFHNHPGSYLMAGMFEEHDKSMFELTAFSFGPDTQDKIRQRISAAFDRFIDVRNLSDKEVAMLARDLEIDIAVDRKGFTKYCRTGIFALRAAPVQVSYLAYPGTMGAGYIDYLIADATIIPEADQQHYSEKIAYLPNSYQGNDAKRRISDRVFTKAELGLPETGFVFCCFNNNYKITPSTFTAWMRILNQVEGSVLWLFEDNAKAASNLRKEAVLRGINSERLVFAKRMPLAEHLARHRMADLFLDTLPYNAHTTASDALWAGLPVLTCLGKTFAGRVAAGLLNAIHLPELITTTPESYEAVAIELANNPDRLRKIKQKLVDNRLTTPLFDTRLYTRHIEAAYMEMYERYRADLALGHIYVRNQSNTTSNCIVKST
jgi:predicted O-linked N-acetylglucosamine transferase (SPINDLY family)